MVHTYINMWWNRKGDRNLIANSIFDDTTFKKNSLILFLIACWFQYKQRIDRNNFEVYEKLENQIILHAPLGIKCQFIKG